MRARTLLEMRAAAEAPLRSELFSADQMERHGKALAAGHKLRPAAMPWHAADRLLTRLTENEALLVAAGDLLKAAATAAAASRGLDPMRWRSVFPLSSPCPKPSTRSQAGPSRFSSPPNPAVASRTFDSS